MQWQKRERCPVRLGINIEVDAMAMSKLWLWTDQARGEVSALGMVDEIRDEQTGVVIILRVTDVHLIKQVSTDAETELDPKAVAELMLELETSGQDISKLRFWWHSHGNLAVFWSDQDESCVSDLANCEYLVSLVVNKRRDSLCRLDSFHPCHMYLSDVHWEVYYALPEGLSEMCSAEFQAKVTEGSLMSRWKLNGNARQQVEELQSAQLGMITYGELDWGEEDTPF